MISFKANYIDSATVIQNEILKSYPKEVSFVELDPNNKLDVISANRANMMWDDKCNRDEYFGDSICKSLNRINSHKSTVREKERFFVLTSQLSNFEHLISNKILAMAQIMECGKNIQFVEYLQVAPKNSHKANCPEFSYVGTAMLNSLKKLFFREKIALDSINEAVGFYLKNGFKDLGKSGPTERRMVFENLIRKM